MRDEIVGGVRVRELGFGVRIFKKAGEHRVRLRRHARQGIDRERRPDVEYVLAGLTIGPIPLGSFSLRKASVLVARNFVPRLPAPSGIEQNLRHVQRGTRRSRPGSSCRRAGSSARGSRSRTAWAVGVGLRIGLGNTDIVKLDAFGLWLSIGEEWSLLIGLELRFKDNPNPIGWLAVEYDDPTGRWGATGGLAIGMDMIFDKFDLPQVAEVTGSAYLANEPRTVAIGHIEDVDSWLQFKVQYERFELLLRVGFCFYDYAGDPPITAYGFVVTGRGSSSSSG